MAYSQRNDEFNPDNFGSNLPGLATSGEADVLHSINNLLAGSLDLTDACVTPSHLRRTEQSCDTDSSNSRNMVFTSNSSMSSTEEMSPSWPTGSRNPSSWAWSCQEMNMVYTSTPKSSNTPAVEGHVMAPQDSFKDNEPILNMGTYLKHYMSPVTTPQEFYPSSNELETGMIRSSSGSLCEKMSNLHFTPSGLCQALNDPRDLLHQNPPLETMCTSSPMMAQMSSASSTTSSIHQQPPTSPFVVADLVDLKDVVEFEKKASLHHEAAASNFATYTWCGMLPPRTNRNSPYSCKVFLGGVPWDITEVGLTRAFQEYGLVSVEWPSKAGKHSQRPLSGYVYLVFDCEQSVHSLLKDCTVDTRTPYTQDYYFRMSSQRMKCKDVQVVPWVIADSNYVISTNPHLDPSKMVFVGALHGMVNAQALARIMNDLFGGVVYVGIDTDKYRYPIGSGRVAFNNQASYMKALRAAFVEIKTPKFSKKVQIDPYLENSFCQNCGCHPGPYFCREQVCFKYFCLVCWQSHHALRCMSHHQPIMRRLRGQNSTEARPDMMP